MTFSHAAKIVSFGNRYLLAGERQHITNVFAVIWS